MKILFLGDVMGRAGRAGVAERLPALRRDWALDFVVVNGENASGGMGLTAAHAKGLLEAGADGYLQNGHSEENVFEAVQTVAAGSRYLKPDFTYEQ